MNGTIYFRADHELVGRVIAEKLRRASMRPDYSDPIRLAKKARLFGGVGR